MTKTPLYTIEVCYDCLAIHANGETGSDEPTDCVPWGLLPDADVTMGGADCSCKNGYQDECECDQTNFSWNDCDACGSSLGGYRHTFTVWGEK